jgi:hypothetical protein
MYLLTKYSVDSATHSTRFVIREIPNQRKFKISLDNKKADPAVRFYPLHQIIRQPQFVVGCDDAIHVHNVDDRVDLPLRKGYPSLLPYQSQMR